MIERFKAIPDVPRHTRAIVWLRRDLRVRDNVALLRAALASDGIAPVFVLDPAILTSERIGAPIVQTFFSALAALRDELRSLGGELALLEGDPAAVLPAFADRIGATAVYANRDYEPDAIVRDARVERSLADAGVAFHASLDHVHFGADKEGGPYRVFTPYMRRWMERYHHAARAPVASLERVAGRILDASAVGATREVPVPEEYGFASSPDFPISSEALAREALDRFVAHDGPVERYERSRDLPAVDGTSHLSPHLRAGTIGIRTVLARAFEARNAEVWIAELVWREFYQMILARFPHVATSPFVEVAREIPWRDDDAAFAAWCEGRTGVPIVDAAMRQLNRYGWMHNRLRMIAASFLTKDLLISWQRGERYFEQHLADADLAQNNGGWQWAASTGTDAVPYFRIFNPETQAKKFDPDQRFIRAMLSEFGTLAYPDPIIDHAFARRRAIETIGRVLGKGVHSS